MYNASLSVTVGIRNKLEFTLHYICSNTLISAAAAAASNGNVYYGLGPPKKQWRHMNALTGTKIKVGGYLGVYLDDAQFESQV